MSLNFSQLGRRQVESDIARLMTLAIERPELLSLAAGFTDNETLPLDDVAEIVAGIRRDGDLKSLQYGANQGLRSLRDALTERFTQQDTDCGIANAGSADPDLSIVTNGSQQALYLAIQTLCDPGDVILVEQPTYFVFLELLRGLGVEAAPMPMSDSGDVDVAALNELLAGYEASGEIERVKAVYLVSYFANPTGHTISEECKRGVVEVLSRFEGRIALIEDAAYRELRFSAPVDVPSVFGCAVDMGSDVPVFYTTTLTKPFATGLKVGYGYCNHPGWLKRMLAVKGQQDFGTSRFAQEIMYRAIVGGAFDRRLAVLRDSYERKMQVLDESLRRELEGSGWRWETPKGGLYLWLTAPDGVDTGFDSAFHARCLEVGVMYVPGQLCYPTAGMSKWIRLSYGVLRLEELKMAGQRFCGAARAIAAEIA